MNPCPECRAEGHTYHEFAYNMGNGSIVTQYARCLNGHAWTNCPWCGLLAKRENRCTMPSTDDGGCTVVEIWRCEIMPAHHWIVPLPPDELSEEIHRELEDDSDTLF